jgi:hypothetical protein
MCWLVEQANVMGKEDALLTFLKVGAILAAIGQPCDE